MAVFRSRQVAIRDIKAMDDQGELDLTPVFQRRNVWPEKARSYLVDTILRGKPIPTIYLRTAKNPRTGTVRQEVVDGQQRLRTVLAFLADAFPIQKIHNEHHGDKTYTELSPSTQEDVLAYEFTCNFLLDAPDRDVWDIFARLNKYPVKINPQELRNSQYFGEFKSICYELANEFNTFWVQAVIFTPTQISRMAEAEFVSELMITASEGIKGKSKAVIDKAYAKWDEDFPNRTTIADRFRRSMDLIGAILHDSPPTGSFRRVPLFYTLFCAIYHMQFGLPGIRIRRKTIPRSDIPRIRIALEKVDQIFQVDKSDVSTLPPKERKFRLATDVHTIHASNRLIRVQFVIPLITRALR